MKIFISLIRHGLNHMKLIHALVKLKNDNDLEYATFQVHCLFLGAPAVFEVNLEVSFDDVKLMLEPFVKEIEMLDGF